MWRIVYRINLPRDIALFWDGIGRLADAFARLALEDPFSDFISLGWTISIGDRAIVIPGGVYVMEKEGKKYYAFRTNGTKTILCIFDPQSPIPFTCDIVDYSLVRDIDDRFAEVVFPSLA